MSYEGSEMYLCQNGHLAERDCYDSLAIYATPPSRDPEDYVPFAKEKADVCPDCGAALVWWCGIDQTNHSGVWPVLVEFEPAKTETCECCGAVKVLAEQRYCIPNNVGHMVKGVEPLVPTGVVKFRVLDPNTIEWREFDDDGEAIRFLDP